MNPATRRDMYNEILDKARELFGSKGYTVTSINDLADAVGVTKGALYYHFKSKEAILDALVKEPAEDLTRIAGDAEGQSARTLLGALIDLQARYPAAYMALQSGEASVLQEYSQRHDFEGKNRRITLAVAGSNPSPARLIRAQMAVAAVKEGTMAALLSNEGSLPDDVRLAVLDAALKILD